MSWSALAWAGKQRPGRASDKLVLIALADRHNEEADLAYPSVNWLCEFCDLNRKTVIASLQRLEALGLISDSGQRSGTTKQIKAYRLCIETVPKVEQSLKRNSSEKSRKESQKRDTEPSLEPSSPSDASHPSERRARVEFPCPADCDALDWASLVKLRKDARRPMNAGAYRQIVNKLTKWTDAGWPPGPILAHAVERGWLTVFPTDEMKAALNGPPRTNQHFPGNSTLRELAERSLANG